MVVCINIRHIEHEGSNMSNKKYTETTINAIKELVADETMTMSACAQKLGIPFSSFKHVCVRLGVYSNRKHLQPPKISCECNEKIRHKSRQILDSIISGNQSNITSTKLKARLLKHDLIKNECSECGIGGVWNGKPIVLQLDHIDGNSNNNLLDNLRILCPNCHSQTHTYCRAKSTTFNRANYNSLESIIANNKPKTIFELANLLGITHAAGNYKTIRKELIARNLELDAPPVAVTPINITRVCTLCDKPICNNSKSGLCKSCVHISQHRCKHPTREQLIDELKTSNPYAIGKKYGVSDNAIRAWMRRYLIPTKKHELREYLASII